MIQKLPSETGKNADISGPINKLSVSREDGKGPSDQSADDSELFIRKSFEEDPQKGCELLFRLYYRGLCTHAVRFVYSKEVAEDLVSELFCNFWTKRAYQSVRTSYRAYLFRAVRNRAYNFLSNDLRKSDSLTMALSEEHSLTESPEQIMQLEELHHTLNALIASLPPQCRKVFLMSRFEGQRSKDIAGELGLSVRTVETHIFKALSTLKNGLKDQWI